MPRKGPAARNGMRKEFKASVKEDEKLHGVVKKAMKKVSKLAEHEEKEDEGED
jgi:Ca2+-dependent lipid-binding protein